jgi:hypothetical protein
MKKAYDDLIKYLYKHLKNDKNYKIQFIPFGSVTQFLSGKNGDIDLFLNITKNSIRKENKENIKIDKSKILEKLYKILKKLDNQMTFHQTNRLCLFTITFQNVKIDVNVYGICSYFGEILLRDYSLIDFRFPMLVIYLKYVIGVKGIKNNEENKSYINSFAWTNIIITFLQDILSPPVLPKLLNEKNRKEIKINVGGKGLEREKVLKDEYMCQDVRNFNVISYEEFSKEVNHAGNRKKDTINKMTTSEIFLKFAEFIGYIFNYKYTIVNTSYECQNFMPIIFENKLKDEGTKRFMKKCKKAHDLLLIREPFDHTYNPCKSVPEENLEKIKLIMRNIYKKIIEEGSI